MSRDFFRTAAREFDKSTNRDRITGRLTPEASVLMRAYRFGVIRNVDGALAIFRRVKIFCQFSPFGVPVSFVSTIQGRDWDEATDISTVTITTTKSPNWGTQVGFLGLNATQSPMFIRTENRPQGITMLNFLNTIKMDFEDPVDLADEFQTLRDGIAGAEYVGGVESVGVFADGQFRQTGTLPITKGGFGSVNRSYVRDTRSYLYVPSVGSTSGIDAELFPRPDNQFGSGFGFSIRLILATLRKSRFSNLKKQLITTGDQEIPLGYQTYTNNMAEVDCSIETENEVLPPEPQFLSVKNSELEGEPVATPQIEKQTVVFRIPEMELPARITPSCFTP